MAYYIEKLARDGKRVFELRAYHAGKKRYYSRRWTAPDGWSQRRIEKELHTQSVEFQNRVDAGEVLSRQEQKEKDAADKAAAAAEAAKYKTVREYADKVFMPTKEPDLAENTRLSYRSNLDLHILPVIGDIRLVDVTPAIIAGLLLDLKKAGYSHGTQVKVYNVLNGLFEMALFDDSIPVSPMSKVKRPKQKKDDRAITEADKAFTAEEMNHVLSCLSKEPLKWQAFVFLAADTGARRGELCGLRWADIDFKKGAVTFKHNLQYSKIKGGVYDVAPKGGKFRSVDVGEETIALLKLHQKEQAERRISQWVFTVDGEDAPMFPTSPTKYFKTFGDRYNIPGFHPHGLRHTSASLSLTNGGDIKSIAERLGHKDASVTLRMYAHANDESIRKAGQAARDALRKQREEQNEQSAEA